MTAVQKQLACLEDLELGTGLVVQDRNGVAYTLTRINLVPAVDSVDDLALLDGYDKATVGLTNYKKTVSGWIVDPIPREAIDELGEAAGRNTTGPGDLLHKGFAGIGGAAAVGTTGLSLGMQASVADTTLAGAPVDELCAVLTLPGATTNLVQLAVVASSGALYVRSVGGPWSQVVLHGSNVTFNAVKAESVRANSVGTPKD